MRRPKTYLLGASLLPMVLALVCGVAGCGKAPRYVVVVEESNAVLLTLFKADEGSTELTSAIDAAAEDLWTPGRIVLFRHSCDVSHRGPTEGQLTLRGEAGTVYRVTDRLELEEVGVFDLALDDAALVEQYAR